jgi:hypothetical protein
MHVKLHFGHRHNEFIYINVEICHIGNATPPLTEASVSSFQLSIAEEKLSTSLYLSSVLSQRLPASGIDRKVKREATTLMPRYHWAEYPV